MDQAHGARGYVILLPMAVQIGGPVGPFLDNVQQRQVPVTLMATCEYMPSGPVSDRAQLDQHVQAQMYRAIRDVVGQKMASGQLTFRHLGTGDMAAVIPEIVAMSGLEQQGLRVSNLSMAFGIDGHAPQPPAGGPPRDNLAAGTFDLGGGQQLHVKINGMTPENFVKDRASAMVWGWIIGAVIIGIMVLTAVGFGIYIYVAAKNSGAPSAARAAAGAKWDGKSTFECGGADVVAITGVTATAGVKAGASCQLTLSGVNITAPVGIEASGAAKVTMAGGSINASTNSVVASGASHVDLVGTKVTGHAKTSGAAKVTGAP
jgi:hypothetical protein